MVYQLKHKLELTEQPNPAYVALSEYELVSQMLWQESPHDFATRQWDRMNKLDLFDAETLEALGKLTDAFISFAESVTYPNNAMPDHSLDDMRKAHAQLEKLNFKSQVNKCFNPSDQY